MKKIIVLGVVFVALLALGGYLFTKGKKQAPQANPLDGVAPENVVKVVVNRADLKVTLETQDGQWNVTSPIKDVAEYGTVDLILNNLKNMAITSVISEKKEKLPQFELDEARATHVQVFLKSQESPVLDFFVGKQASGYANSYVRLNGSDEIRVATELVGYHLRKDLNEFRQNRVLPVSAVDVTAVKITSGKNSYAFSVSSASWINEKTGKPVDQTWVKTLTTKFENWMVVSYGTGQETPEETGFDKPRMKVTLQTSARTVVTTAGSILKKDTTRRYVSREGRDAVLIVDESNLMDVDSYLKTLK